MAVLFINPPPDALRLAGPYAHLKARIALNLDPE